MFGDHDDGGRDVKATPTLTKRAAKKRAILAAADMAWEAARQSHIFEGKLEGRELSDAEVSLCVQALSDVAAELYAKAAKID